MAYDPRTYWSRVAQEIESRGNGNVVAGDDTPFYRYQRAQFVSRFLLRMPIHQRSVLEIGCGPGGNLKALGPLLPSRRVGCDISSSMVELATRNAGVECVLIDGITLPFQDREFDVTFTVTVLQHNPRPMMHTLVRDICRVTREWMYLFEDTGEPSEAYSMFTRRPSDYSSVCEREGFVLKQVTYLNVGISERVCNTLMGRLNRKDRKEGEPLTRWSTLAESLALPFTRVADRFIRRNSGLTLISLRRN